MLRIGYVRLRDAGPDGDVPKGAADEAAALRALGCQVVRAEEPARPGSDPFATLHSILDFIGSGDELVAGQLDDLGTGGRAMLAVLERLERRGASLRILKPELSSRGPGGAALRAALEAVAAIEPGAASVIAGRPPPRRSAPCRRPASGRWRSHGAWASAA